MLCRLQYKKIKWKEISPNHESIVGGLCLCVRLDDAGVLCC